MRIQSRAEARRRVLEVLRPGGLLTLAQISRDAEVPRVLARLAVSALVRAELVAHGVGIGEGRYRITSAGLARAQATVIA